LLFERNALAAISIWSLSSKSLVVREIMVEKSAETMQQARVAIRKGRLTEARRLLRQLVRDEPQNHAVWLLLARATPSSKAALEYVKRAESLQPDSLLVHRARTGLEQKINAGAGRSNHPRWRIVVFVSCIALLFTLIAVWFGPMAWERVSALKNDNVADVLATATLVPTVETNTQVVTIPVATLALLPTPTIRPTEVSVSNMMTVSDGTDELEDESVGVSGEIPDQETSLDLTGEMGVESVPTDPTGLRPYGVGATENWIDVNLSTQTLVAYEGNTPVYNSLISSGTREYPTVTGQYRTYMKYETQDMNGYLIGYDYYLQNVPYVMYFSGNFAIHGAYWHNNFGVPMSHGCVNVNPVDAGWLYNWAPVGTTVNIHN
jgi:lipoprotein-anchoring transpeptidase ErfK/SrfK